MGTEGEAGQTSRLQGPRSRLEKSWKGVLKSEKFPNTRKPSHCRICAEPTKSSNTPTSPPSSLPSLFFSISLHCSLKKVFLSLCCSLELCIHLGISFPFSFAFCFPNTKLENIKRHRNFRNKKITVLKA